MKVNFLRQTRDSCHSQNVGRKKRMSSLNSELCQPPHQPRIGKLNPASPIPKLHRLPPPSTQISDRLVQWNLKTKPKTLSGEGRKGRDPSPQVSARYSLYLDKPLHCYLPGHLCYSISSPTKLGDSENQKVNSGAWQNQIKPTFLAYSRRQQHKSAVQNSC